MKKKQGYGDGRAGILNCVGDSLNILQMDDGNTQEAELCTVLERLIESLQRECCPEFVAMV